MKSGVVSLNISEYMYYCVFIPSLLYDIKSVIKLGLISLVSLCSYSIANLRCQDDLK